MGYYDHFHSWKTITPVGRWLLGTKNQHFVKLIKQHCASEQLDLLEIGCGQGYFAEQCRKSGIRYTALEGNPHMAAALSQRGFDVHAGFAPPLRLDRSFDAIFMDQVFEHMKGADHALEMIDACKARLKESGILFISSPDIFTFRHDFYSDHTHALPTCMPMLQRMFADCDLEIVHQDHVVFFIRGLLWTRLLAYVVRFSYGIGLFHVMFGRRAYLAKISLMPSCVIIGKPRARREAPVPRDMLRQVAESTEES